MARDKHHLTDLCHLIRHDTPYLFQEYVKESHGRDVRVVLVGGRVIGSMLRCSTDGRMQSNCSLGRQDAQSESELKCEEMKHKTFFSICDYNLPNRPNIPQKKKNQELKVCGIVKKQNN